MSELELRASDAERERALALLSEHCAEGRLTLDELAERVEVVQAARTRDELERVTADLPAAPAHRRAARLTLAVFAHVVRRGRLRLARWTWAASVFGDLDLDLRDARLDGPRATVLVSASFGNVDLYVPEGVETDVAGMPVFGHVRTRGRETEAQGTPVVRVRVLALFGTVDVWRVPPGTKGELRDVIKQVRELTS